MLAGGSAEAQLADFSLWLERAFVEGDSLQFEFMLLLQLFLFVVELDLV